MGTGLNRRTFLGLTVGAAAAAIVRPPPLRAAEAFGQVRAVAFDAFPIFDPRPISALTDELFPGRGAEFRNVWRARQFEYTWLRTVAHQYANFWQVTGDALDFAAASLKLDLTPEKRERLMNAYLKLKPWPDVVDAIEKLKSSGLRLAFVSNFTREMLQAGLRNSGLDRAIEHVLSTDEVKQFKPAPRAYQMAVDAFGLRKEQIVFAAFAGWDAAGAKWFGFPTVWVNRMDAPIEALAAAPEVVCRDMSGLLAFVNTHRS
jgi:2-haloacid dehalogenase